MFVILPSSVDPIFQDMNINEVAVYLLSEYERMCGKFLLGL